MAEKPTLKLEHVQRYLAEQHFLEATEANLWLALLSRQNEELRKALVEIAEIKPTELTIGNSYFRPAFEVDWAVWNRAREIARTALSSAPSPSETEKSG